MALDEFGGPDVLRPGEMPEPVAGSGQLTVRIVAASVNPVDTALRSGVFADFF